MSLLPLPWSASQWPQRHAWYATREGLSGKCLFMGPTPHQFTQALEESASRMIRSFTEDQLHANNLEDLVQAVIDEKVPRPIVLDVERHRIDNGILPPASETGDGWAAAYRPAPAFPERELIQRMLFIPYTGREFRHEPRTHPVRRGGASHAIARR